MISNVKLLFPDLLMFVCTQVKEMLQSIYKM